ncbi:S4 domain-containing protein YaaA [Oceanivirga salmonicida]|uniref:S4 domain-containing protein YaaA n=1 Tax=Oceanivirga salmonicida TaxID=1769291 RepID=UPI00083192EB|nr:S4 domain-containing protein YaaA [Oceanivirga salmonicida]
MEIEIKGEYIKLDQLLKFANLVASGGEAKEVIKDGLVLVNGEVETRRGKKIRNGDIVVFANEEITVK